MALDVAAFAARTPLLWHLTTRENYARIARTRTLESAATLMRAAGDERWLRERRRDPQRLSLGGETVWLRDQAPLAAGAIALLGGWTFERLVEEINHRVYFWPGTRSGPIQQAWENFHAFRGLPGTVTLRIPFEAVARACHPFQLQVTAVNVGAPRTSGGKKSPRGPHTFASPGAFPGTPSDVREVAVRDVLPLDAIWSDIVVDGA